MKDISVEYAHIYTNNKIGEEHKTSLEILSALKTEEDSQHKSFSLVVMVDDYSFPDPSFDYEEFIIWLSEKGFKPDVVFRESQLIPLCDEVLKLINDIDLKNQISDYVRSKKYPCSLFIATWYLLRLGCITFPPFSPEFYAKEILNILPDSFKPFEDKGLEIISSTKFADKVENIHYRYFKGRLVA